MISRLPKQSHRGVHVRPMATDKTEVSETEVRVTGAEGTSEEFEEKRMNADKRNDMTMNKNSWADMREEEDIRDQQTGSEDCVLGAGEGGQGLDDKEEDEGTVKDGDLEARDPLRRRVAARPTTEDIRKHRVSHLPFRDWCPECIAGAANDWPHRSRDKSSEIIEVPEVHADYCFPKDQVGGDYAVVLVARDRETKMTVAHVVPHKGAEQEWVAEQLVRDLLKFGHHGELTLKTDQEPAIVDLMRVVASLRGSNRTTLEQSPTADSSGNGIAERAIQSVEKLLRVHKLSLEGRLGDQIAVKHPFLPDLSNTLPIYSIDSLWVQMERLQCRDSKGRHVSSTPSNLPLM